MSNVYVRWSGDTVQPDARTPTTFCCASMVVSPWKMRLSTSRVLSLVSNRGLRMLADPTRASTAVPPRAGFGTVATGWHPASARTAANAAATRGLLEMSRHPDVGDRAHEKGRHEHPRRPVDLPLEPAAGAVAAAQPGVAATDRAAEA